MTYDTGPTPIRDDKNPVIPCVFKQDANFPSRDRIGNAIGQGGN